MRRAGLSLLLLIAACKSAATTGTVDDARRVDEEALVSNAAAIDAPLHAGKWIVVQRGEVVASASLPDDAVRAAQKKDVRAAHRFVFRPTDTGQRLYRMTFVAEGGVVIGKRFLADLALEAGGAPDRPVLRRRTGGTGLDLSKDGHVTIELASLDGAARRTVSAAYDRDFDGGLLLPRDVAAALSLELFEIPGGADVQVALARPFRAHRATVLAKIAALDASGAAEVVYEAKPAISK